MHLTLNMAANNIKSFNSKGILPQLNAEYAKYSPQLLTNSSNENVLSAVVEELTHCQSFMFVVAFVTESGLATLKSHFFDLKRKGIGGRLLTSTYLNFNHPNPDEPEPIGFL